METDKISKRDQRLKPHKRLAERVSTLFFFFYPACGFFLPFPKNASDPSHTKTSPIVTYTYAYKYIYIYTTHTIMTPPPPPRPLTRGYVKLELLQCITHYFIQSCDNVHTVGVFVQCFSWVCRRNPDRKIINTLHHGNMVTTNKKPHKTQTKPSARGVKYATQTTLNGGGGERRYFVTICFGERVLRIFYPIISHSFFFFFIIIPPHTCAHYTGNL